MDNAVSVNYIILVFLTKFILSILGMWLSPPDFRKVAAVPFIGGAICALIIAGFYLNFEIMRPYGQSLLRFALVINELSHILLMLVAFSALGINITKELRIRFSRLLARIKSWKPPSM